MAFARNWLEINPLDHLKFKSISGEVREFKVDVSDRLKTILSGFVSGDTLVGIKLGKYLTNGTAAPTAPSGTGTALDANSYLRTTGTGTYGDFYLRMTTGGEIRLTILDKLCLDNARISNNTWLTGNNTNSAAQNILKINTANALEVASHIFVPNTNPATNLELTPKGYVDASIKAQNLSQTISEAQLVGALGAWASKSNNTVYEAATDGFVIGYSNQTGDASTTAIGYTDSSNPPTTVRWYDEKGRSGATYNSFRSILFMPVKKGDYWKVVFNQTATIFWISLGS